MTAEVMKEVINSGLIVVLIATIISGLKLLTTYFNTKTDYLLKSKELVVEQDIIVKAESAIKTAVAQISQQQADQIKKDYNGTIPEDFKADLKTQASDLSILLMGTTVYSALKEYKKETGVNSWINAMIEVFVRQLK